MAASPKRSLALDTNLLLDLAGKKDFAHEFKDEFFSRGYSLLVPPTLVAELAFFAPLEAAAQHELANSALAQIRSRLVARASGAPETVVEGAAVN